MLRDAPQLLPSGSLQLHEFTCLPSLPPPAMMVAMSASLRGPSLRPVVTAQARRESAKPSKAKPVKSKPGKTANKKDRAAGGKLQESVPGALLAAAAVAAVLC